MAKITVDGNTYELAWDFNAIAQVQAETGIHLFSGFRAGEFNAVEFRAGLYAALLPNHPEMTLTDAGKLITKKTLDKIAEAINEVWASGE